MNRQEAIQFAKESVWSAQGNTDFGSFEAALDAYRDNLTDTLNEKGVNAYDQPIAGEAFDLEVVELTKPKTKKRIKK